MKAEPRDAIYEKNFNTPGRMTLCENLWYTPRHFFPKLRLRGGIAGPGKTFKRLSRDFVTSSTTCRGANRYSKCEQAGNSIKTHEPPRVSPMKILR